jgi:hypothetical protein
VKTMLLAAALAATAAIAAPVFAQPAENTGAAPAQAAPAVPGSQPVNAGGDQGRADQWRHGQGHWGMRGPMMHQMMMRRMMMMRGDPQQRCVDRLAWRAARAAYVETKLDLTADQRPLWDKLQSIAQGEQQKERQLCQALKPGEQSTLLGRMDRAEGFLSARLDAVKQAKPAVQALYQALTPQQQAIMDHPFRP